MIIEGKPSTISQSIEKVYNFLADFNNFEPLMPDQITNWVSDKESCSFTIQGMADIKLTYDEKITNSMLKTPYH